jgi:hypothetical protein
MVRGFVVGAAAMLAATNPAAAQRVLGVIHDSATGEPVSGAVVSPDDEVLLDGSFADTHCLRVVPSDRTHVEQVGIGFEPVDDPSRDTLVDISGVLWIDRRRPALRSLEFEYTNLESVGRRSGGEIVFPGLSNGAPIIQRWTIHSAIIADDGEFNPYGVRRRPPPRSRGLAGARLDARYAGHRHHRRPREILIALRSAGRVSPACIG